MTGHLLHHNSMVDTAKYGNLFNPTFGRKVNTIWSLIPRWTQIWDPFPTVLLNRPEQLTNFISSNAKL